MHEEEELIRLYCFTGIKKRLLIILTLLILICINHRRGKQNNNVNCNVFNFVNIVHEIGVNHQFKKQINQ